MKTLTGSGRPRNPDDPLDPNFNPNEEPSYPEAEPDDEPRSKSRRPLRRLQCLPTSGIRFGILRSTAKQSGVAS